MRHNISVRILDNIVFLFTIVLGAIFSYHFLSSTQLFSFTNEDVEITIVLLVCANLRKEAVYFQIDKLNFSNPAIKVGSLVYLIILTLFYCLYSLMNFKTITPRIVIALIIAMIGFYLYIFAKYIWSRIGKIVR